MFSLVKRLPFGEQIYNFTMSSMVSASSSAEDDYVEDVVCRVDDVADNQMKAFELSDAGKVLVVKKNGVLSAVGSKCTHYGAPLETGVLSEGRVRCPWHGACFNIRNGDIEDFPGLDSLPCFEVKVEDNNVKVRAKRSEVKSSKRTKTMTLHDTNNREHYVIVGGGPSAATCAETLRQEGFSGKITMVAKENALPYDRVKISKTMDVDISKLQLRTEEFYKVHNITVLKRTEATHVDCEKKTVDLSDGTTLSFNKLYLATGSKPFKPKIPGSNIDGVMVIRNYDDGKRVVDMLKPSSNVVVLGSSFIALEAASYCVGKAKSVKVVARSSVPFEPLLGPKVGAAVAAFFKEKGVEFITKSGIASCGGSGRLAEVELSDGQKIPADICIMGTGSTFCTDFLQGSQIKMNTNGAIDVNEYLETNVKSIYAGGDIAYAPVYSNHNKKSAIGHYPLAHYHGRIAGQNMAGKQTPLKAVPFFWTMLFGKSIRYAGHGSYDDILYVGDVDQLQFVAYYLSGNVVVAVSSCGKDPIVAKYAELRASGRELLKEDLGGDLLEWTRR